MKFWSNYFLEKKKKNRNYMKIHSKKLAMFLWQMYWLMNVSFFFWIISAVIKNSTTHKLLSINSFVVNRLFSAQNILADDRWGYWI